MPWIDHGLIFHVSRISDWMHSHAYVPTAVLLPDRIRVFVAFWDSKCIGRPGYIDCAIDRPEQVIGWSRVPVLTLGAPGRFDSSGITPMACRIDNSGIRLYYAGWQRDQEIRYRILTGLAISHDGGNHFIRQSDDPIIGRNDVFGVVRSGFFACFASREWKAWLAQSREFRNVDGVMRPVYDLYYAESQDGISWSVDDQPCMLMNSEIYGYGRSAIWEDESGGGYHGLFSVRRKTCGYRLEYASSPDGRHWTELTSGGMAFPPESTCDGQRETMFASVLKVSGKFVCYYNGDDFGRSGLRAAVWKD